MKELRLRLGHQAAGASLDLFLAIEGRHGPLWFEADCGNTQGALMAPHALVDLGLAEQVAGRNSKPSCRSPISARCPPR